MDWNKISDWLRKNWIMLILIGIAIILVWIAIIVIMAAIGIAAIRSI